MITFDHIAVGAASLMDGLEWIEETLHMKIPAGGKHDQMGTHNHIISSGDAVSYTHLTLPTKA